MAIYRILRKNGMFRGFPGEEISFEPGALVDAAVRAGMLQRIDMAPEAPKEDIKIQERRPKVKREN
jgi:hypothetical protein